MKEINDKIFSIEFYLRYHLWDFVTESMSYRLKNSIHMPIRSVVRNQLSIKIRFYIKENM